jgi:copper(I)-binding protein
MPLHPRALAIAAALLVAPLVGCGSGDGSAEASGSFRVVRATADVPANPDLASVRMVVENGSARADVLTSASSPDADDVSVHRSEVDDAGLATMRPVTRLAIPARSKVTFAPGGLHVMLEGLHRTLVAGDTLRLRLRFAEAGTRTVVVRVVEPGTTPEPTDTMEPADGG